MNKEPDWALWRSFAAVVREGSLSAAARELDLSQPTLGRHIEALEQTLGVTLFERTLTGLKPNDIALGLYEPVLDARRALAEAAILAAGAEANPGGTVRITASTVMSNYVLPTIIADLRQRYPAIALELVPSDSTENLLLREADIAIRMFRPTQLELVTRKLGDLPIVATAHERYLEKHGAPAQPSDLAQHDLIGFDRSDLIIKAAKDMGFTLDRGNFRLRSDSQTLLWEMMKAGLGIGFAQTQLVRATPGMRAILPQMPIPVLPVWLTSHRELFTSQRIRAIYDGLAAALVSYIAS